MTAWERNKQIIQDLQSRWPGGDDAASSREFRYQDYADVVRVAGYELEGAQSVLGADEDGEVREPLTERQAAALKSAAEHVGRAVRVLEEVDDPSDEADLTDEVTDS